jgi:hypothetical protein
MAGMGIWKEKSRCDQQSRCDHPLDLVLHLHTCQAVTTDENFTSDHAAIL